MWLAALHSTVATKAIAEEGFHPPGRLQLQKSVVGFHLCKATAFKKDEKVNFEAVQV